MALSRFNGCKARNALNREFLPANASYVRQFGSAAASSPTLPQDLKFLLRCVVGGGCETFDSRLVETFGAECAEECLGFVSFCNERSKVAFGSSWVGGGYGKYNAAIIDVVRSALFDDGIPLNTTYAGKAFEGMKKFVAKRKIYDQKIPVSAHRRRAVVF